MWTNGWAMEGLLRVAQGAARKEKIMENTEIRPVQMSPAELSAYAASLLKPSDQPWWVGRRVDPSTSVVMTQAEVIEVRRFGYQK